MDPYLWKRLWRRPWLSASGLILSAVLCFLLVFLTGYQQSQETELAQIKTQYDIRCLITDRKGTKSTGLRQEDAAAVFVLDQSEQGLGQYIRDVRITKEFTFTALDAAAEGTLVGVTNERCAADLDPAKGGAVTLFDDNFYQQDGYKCIVSEWLYKELEQDVITLYIQDPYVDPKSYAFYGTGTIEFQVAGWYAGDGSEIYMSFAGTQRLADEYSGGLRSFDSMEFLAADNENLEGILTASRTYFGAVDPSSSYPKLAITIQDEQYRATVAALEQNIERTGHLLPVVAVLGLGMGFLISFLATRGERRTYALMRTLGMTGGRLFLAIMREQIILQFFAALLIGLLMGKPLPAFVYLLCHTLGCCAAVVRSVRVPPTAILREQE